MSRLLPLGILLLSIGACRVVGDTGVVDGETEAALLPFPLVDGVTTREDAVLLLGAPIAEFEGARLAVHRMIVGKSEKLQPFFSRTDEWTGSDRRLYDLVLVFENGIVCRHSLVKLR